MYIKSILFSLLLFPLFVSALPIFPIPPIPPIMVIPLDLAPSADNGSDNVWFNKN